MEDKDNIVTSRVTQTLTFKPWHAHIKEIFCEHWISFFLIVLSVFGVLWGIVEALSYFYTNIDFPKQLTFTIIIIISILIGLIHTIYKYLNVIPIGLENESREIQKIAHIRKRFWEYRLAYALLNKHISKINQDIEDLSLKRIHVMITKTLNVFDYLDWIGRRPTNLLSMVEIATQLLIKDLPKAIQSINRKEINISNLIRIIDLIRDLYESIFQFQKEGLEIKIPEGFELLHKLQFEWTPVFIDGFKQILVILESVSNRKKNDLSPVVGNIVLKEPPKIAEFNAELQRLESIANNICTNNVL